MPGYKRLQRLAHHLEEAERRQATQPRCALCPARRHVGEAVAACRAGQRVSAAYHCLQAMGFGLYQRCGLPDAIQDIAAEVIDACIQAGDQVPLSEGELAFSRT